MSPPAPRHRFVSANGLRLHLVEAGDPAGPTVVLLHGFPEFWHGWRHQIPILAEAGFRVLVPDQRGYNLSDKPRRVRDYRLDRLAEDVIGILDAHGSETAYLVGHDWGAMVAWWVAIRYPQRLRRLAVLNVPHPAVMRRFLLRDRKQRRKSWYVFFFQLPWLPEYWYRRRGFAIGTRSLVGSSRRGTFSRDDLTAYREAWSQPGALRSMIHWYRAALRYPKRNLRSARVEVPTLVLWGERDIFLDRRTVDPSLEMCDDGRAILFPEATHWLQHEEPQRVGEALIAFFRHGSVEPEPVEPTPR